MRPAASKGYLGFLYLDVQTEADLNNGHTLNSTHTKDAYTYRFVDRLVLHYDF